MLYNTTRERFLQFGLGYQALVADALFHAGYSPGSRFTIADALLSLKPYGTSTKIIHAGLRHELFSPRGRRNMVFTMPHENAARRIIGAQISLIRDILPASAFGSLKAYRKAIHGALIARRPGTYQRQLLALRLGVCKQTTLNYDKELGHVVTEQHVTHELTPDKLSALPTEKQRGGRRKFWLAKLDKDGLIEKHAPLVKAIALMWIADGHTVVIIEQTASHYQPSIADKYTGGEYSAFIQS